MNRREFLGKIGLAAGAVKVAPVMRLVPDVGNAGQDINFLLDAVTQGVGHTAPMILDSAFATLEDAIIATPRAMGNAARRGQNE